MRLDRIISLTLAQISTVRTTPSTVILMYHSISNRIEDRVHPYYKTVTTPERFEQQMQWIADAGAEVVSLNNWHAPVTPGKPLRVIITFDDGFADYRTAAFPILRHHGYPSTVFLPTGFIDTGKQLISGVPHLTWDDIQKLSHLRVDFGSHTVNHPHLETLTSTEIDNEIKYSTQSIRERCENSATSFSCPFAFPQAHPRAIRAIRDSLAAHGITVGVTTKIGTISITDDFYTLNRIPINADDDHSLFLAKLTGGYNWLSIFQRGVRRIRKALHRQ